MNMGQMTRDNVINQQKLGAADYAKRLQSFGTDYAGARKFAEEQRKFIPMKGLGAGIYGGYSQDLTKANQQYFGKNKYDYSKGNYDDWLGYQKLVTHGAGNLNAGQQAQMLQKYQQGVAGDRATRFAENLPQYIAQEQSGLQQALGEKMGSARKNLLAEMNKRGLLRSGQRGMGEVDLASQFAGQFEQGRADIYKRAQEQAQKLFTDPTLKGLGYDARSLDVQNQLEQMKQQQSAARSSLFGGAMGLIGQGIGSYYGNKGTGTTPINQQQAFNQYPRSVVS